MPPVFACTEGWTPFDAACSSDSSTRRVSKVWPSCSWIPRAMRSRSLSRAPSCWRTTFDSTAWVSPRISSTERRNSCSRARRPVSSRVRSSESIARRSRRQIAPPAPSSQTMVVSVDRLGVATGTVTPTAQASRIVMAGR